MALDTARPADALAAYDEAYTLDPQPSLLYNRGRALQALERYPEALVLFEQFQRDAPATTLAKVPGLTELISEVRGRTCVVRVHGEPAGAEVRLRGVVVGRIPVSGALRANAGKAELEVSMDGYTSHRATVDLPPGGAYEGHVRLVEVSPRGTLMIRSSTERARVAIDGAPYGTVPYEGRISVGSHRVRLTKDGYDPEEVVVDLVANQRREVDLNLTRNMAIYERWWFWTGIGVLVAGAATAVVVAATRPSAEPGTIAPGVIAFPSGVRF